MSEYNLLRVSQVVDCTGEDALGESVIVTKGDRIDRIVPAENFERPSEFAGREYELGGTALPGFFDSHVHLTDPSVYVRDYSFWYKIRSVTL